MESRIQTYIRDRHMLSDGGRVLVATSGGADSMVLLYVLHRLGYEVIAAHCNFHLRGEESMRDEQFVRGVCMKWAIRLETTDFATQSYAKEQGVSIEMAARDLRYEWFEKKRAELRCEAIAVAHHMNDQAETVLLNLSRGTGVKGLGGMRPKNGYIVRPLLCCSRKEIEAFAETNSIAYVTDSTNSDTSIKRNAFRSMLQQASEAEIRHMAETASLMQSYHALLDTLILGKTLDKEAQLPLLYELLSPYGLNASQIENILQALPSSGKRFEAPEYVATIDHGQLTIQSRQTEEEERPTIIRSIRPRMPREHFPDAEELMVCLDADRLKEPLTARHWKNGDSFYPITSGKAVRKKLQDFFSDQKFSIDEKNATWLLCSGEGEDESIVWVIGYRIDNRYKVTDQTTRIAEIAVLRNEM